MALALVLLVPLVGAARTGRLIAMAKEAAMVNFMLMRWMG